MCIIIQPMIFHSDALKMKEDSWNESVQAHDTHYVHFEHQLGCIPHSVLLWAGLSFPCTSPDNSEVRITGFCSFLVPPFLSLKLVPICCPKCPHLFDCMGLLSRSPEQIKSKEFKRSEGLQGEWKRSVLAFTLPQNIFSLSLSSWP